MSAMALFSDESDLSGLRLGASVVGAISISEEYPPIVSKLHMGILPRETSFRNPFVISAESSSLYGSPLLLGDKGGGLKYDAVAPILISSIISSADSSINAFLSWINSHCGANFRNSTSWN